MYVLENVDNGVRAPAGPWMASFLQVRCLRDRFQGFSDLVTLEKEFRG